MTVFVNQRDRFLSHLCSLQKSFFDVKTYLINSLRIKNYKNCTFNFLIVAAFVLIFFLTQVVACNPPLLGTWYVSLTVVVNNDELIDVNINQIVVVSPMVPPMVQFAVSPMTSCMLPSRSFKKFDWIT